jgi:hypothetical protein
MPTIQIFAPRKDFCAGNEVNLIEVVMFLDEQVDPQIAQIITD